MQTTLYFPIFFCCCCFRQTTFRFPIFLFNSPFFFSQGFRTYAFVLAGKHHHHHHHHGSSSSSSSSKKEPHIKKPLNAFMLYMKEMRPVVQAECTLKESAAINQILGRRVRLQFYHIPTMLVSLLREHMSTVIKKRRKRCNHGMTRQMSGRVHAQVSWGLPPHTHFAVC